MGFALLLPASNRQHLEGKARNPVTLGVRGAPKVGADYLRFRKRVAYNQLNMGKQGTITSFFGNAASNPKNKKENRKAKKKKTETSPLSDKRPRPPSSVSKTSDNKQSASTRKDGQESPAKRAKIGDKIQELQEEPLEEEQNERIIVSDDNSEGTGEKGGTTDLAHRTAEESEEGSEAAEEDQEDADDTATRNKQASQKLKVGVERLSVPRTWKDGKPIPYKFLADAFSKVEEISGRLEIQAILTDVFRNIIASTPEDLVPSIYLCINKLAPAHEGIELGIGESILMKALSQVSGRTVSALKTMYKEIGDLGDVASAARTSQKTMFPPPPLTVRKVFQEFKAIAAISGKSTQDAKRSKIIKMLVAASKSEAKYIARAVLGKLRIHLADKTVIAALAAAVTLEDIGAKTFCLLGADGKKKTKLTNKEEDIEDRVKEAASILGGVYSQLPVWDLIVPKLLELKVIDTQLEEACKLVPGIPVSPMLAKPTKAIDEVLERFADTAFTCEYKYDGERAQVHRLEDGTMKIYSRNAENLTPRYPDLVAKLPLALNDSFKDASFIIDAEAVAFDIEKKKILPFQELQGRKRKDVDADAVTVKVCIFAFDLLFFNGSNLIDQTLKERRKQLSDGFCEQEGEFMFAKGQDSRDPEEIMELLNASIKEGCEGLMVKALEGSNATYEPANRSQNWLKVKKDYLDGCGDSLDLVPIGGYLGRGKRTGTYGAFLLACYDPENEEYQSICKIGTGFSEEVLEQFASFYNDPEAENKIGGPKSYYRTPALKALEPDVWFEPVQVWEVLCADLSISPQHMAAVGHVDPDKGIALRFPRFVRVRDDKKADEATNAEQVAEFYMRQSSVANNT